MKVVHNAAELCTHAKSPMNQAHIGERERQTGGERERERERERDRDRGGGTEEGRTHKHTYSYLSVFLHFQNVEILKYYTQCS